MTSCGPKVIYDQKVEVKNPWQYSSPATFEYEVLDTTISYDLQLDVTHTIDFSFENLYINATTVFPDGKKSTHPVSLQFANESGDWIGNCTGESCNIMIDISSGSFFKTVGKYGLNIEQYSRKDGLEGIKSLTLKITEHQNTK